MTEITREQLQEKLAQSEDFKLVMVAKQESFQSRHIPGSSNAHDFRQGMSLFLKSDDIVLYGCNAGCGMTRTAYRLLAVSGFRSVKLYAGGLTDWEEAGLPLEGTSVEDSLAT